MSQSEMGLKEILMRHKRKMMIEGKLMLTGDMVNHPKHYNQGIEVIDFIESHNMNFNEGNVIKYVARHKHKNGLEDLKKAKWYLEREIAKHEEKRKIHVIGDNKCMVCGKELHYGNVDIAHCTCGASYNKMGNVSCKN